MKASCFRLQSLHDQSLKYMGSVYFGGIILICVFRGAAGRGFSRGSGCCSGVRTSGAPSPASSLPCTHQFGTEHCHPSSTFPWCYKPLRAWTQLCTSTVARAPCPQVLLVLHRCGCKPYTVLPQLLPRLRAKHLYQNHCRVRNGALVVRKFQTKARLVP